MGVVMEYEEKQTRLREIAKVSPMEILKGVIFTRKCEKSDSKGRNDARGVFKGVQVR